MSQRSEKENEVSSAKPEGGEQELGEWFDCSLKAEDMLERTSQNEFGKKRSRLDSLSEEGVRRLGLQRNNTSFAASGMFMFAMMIGIVCCAVSFVTGEG